MTIYAQGQHNFKFKGKREGGWGLASFLIKGELIFIRKLVQTTYEVVDADCYSQFAEDEMLDYD